MPRTRLREQKLVLPQTVQKTAKHFHYLDLPRGAIEGAHLIRELRQCGKRSCRCRQGYRHGPYVFLRYEVVDHDSGESRHRREYVPRGEVRRVRRWVQRYRARTAYAWAVFRWMRQAAQ